MRRVVVVVGATVVAVPLDVAVVPVEPVDPDPPHALA